MSKNVPKVRFEGVSGEWKTARLKDVAEFNPKSVLPEIFEYVDLESVVGTNLISHRTEYKENAPSRAQRLAKQGDVFFQTVRPYQRNNYMYDLPFNNFVFSTGYAQLRPYIDSYFLLGIVQENKFVSDVLDRCTGTSYPAINSNDLAQISIKIPESKIEQQKIGAFFKQLDDTIALQQQLVEHQQKFKKAMLQKMFPQKGKRVPKIRFEGFSGEWRKKRLGYFIKDFVKKTTVQNQYPMLTSSQKYGVILQEEYFDNRQVTTNNVGYYVLPRGYFTYRSRSDNGIFKFNRNDVIDRGIISYFYPVFEIINGDSDFFLKLLNSTTKKQVFFEAEGTGQKVLSLKKFKNIKVLIPSLKEQQKIGAFFKQLDDTIALHQKKLEDYQQLKKALLQRMFV